MPLQNDPPVQQPLNWPAIGRGLLIALALALVLSLLSTLALHFTGLSERFIPWMAGIILLVSSFVGGAQAASRAGTKGLFHGLGVGLGLFLLLIILGLVLAPGPVTLAGLLEKLLLSVPAGVAGGVLGVALAE